MKTKPNTTAQVLVQVPVLSMLSAAEHQIWSDIFSKYDEISIHAKNLAKQTTYKN